MTHDDNPNAPYAGYGPYWNPGTNWGTPAPGPGGDLFPHGYHTDPGVPGDGNLQAIIEHAIRRDPTISQGAHITVQVAHGAVTLTGQVKSGSAKRAAGNAAWYAPGVTDVRNEIEITS